MESEEVFNIVSGEWEEWVDDGNCYAPISYENIKLAVNGGHVPIYLDNINYLKRCYGLVTQNVDTQPRHSQYIPASWFYDKCKEIVLNKEGLS